MALIVRVNTRHDFEDGSKITVSGYNGTRLAGFNFIKALTLNMLQ